MNLPSFSDFASVHGGTPRSLSFWMDKLIPLEWMEYLEGLLNPGRDETNEGNSVGWMKRSRRDK